MKEQLAALYALQQLDSALGALQKQYAGLDQGKAEVAAEVAAKAANEAAVAALRASEGSSTDATLEQKSVEAKIEEYEKKLYSGAIRIPKELQAMQDEIEMLNRNRSRLDERILELEEEIAANRARAAEAKTAMNAATKARLEKVKAYKAASNGLIAQARELTGQRQAGAKAISPSLLARYDSLRATRDGIGIVRIESPNSCGGCKLGLPSDLVTRVKEGSEIIACDNCARILCETPK